MKSSKLNLKLGQSLFSRLLSTYFAIMLMTLAAQGLLLGKIYERQYLATRTQAMTKEATDLAQRVALLWNTSTKLDSTYNYLVYDTARRQEAVVWIADRLYVQSMSYEQSNDNLVPVFESMALADLDPTLQALDAKVMKGEPLTQIGEADYFGMEMLTVAVPIKHNNVPVGVVFMHTGTKSIQLVMGEMYRHIAWSALIAIIIGAMMILFMSSRISRPLVQMNDIARHIARGRFDRRAEVSSRDEIGELATTFNAMAEQLKIQEDMRSGFVANVSHELRSPMTSIHGFAQGMLDGTIPKDEYEKYLQVIVGETRRLNKLIRELLDLSQLESGNFPLNRQVFDINELIRRVLIRFDDTVEEQKQEIAVEFRQERAMVVADPDRIEQVVINLVDNAVKFTGPGGSIRLWTHSAADKMLIGVGDTGPGIPEEEQPYVWERFYKVDKAHTGRRGTGLGLSIVKKIIDEHGERITLQSKPGQGTVFVFTLEKAEKGDKNTDRNNNDKNAEKGEKTDKE